MADSKETPPAGNPVLADWHRARPEFGGDGEAVPDHWAPVNRKGEPVREAVDWFRNTRVMVPATLADAFGSLVLALEWYETCREVERDTHEAHALHLDDEPETRERAIGYLLDADEKSKVTAETRAAALNATGDRSAGSRTAAEKLVDLVPFVVAFNAHARILHRAKLDADKETSIARRRHDTLKVIADRMELVTIGTASRGLAELSHTPARSAEVLDALQGAGVRGGWKPAPEAPGYGESVDRALGRSAPIADGEVSK